MAVRREVDTSSLDSTAAQIVEQLAQSAIGARSLPQRMPDAFEYEIDIDGRTFKVSGDDPAWRALIDQVGVQ